MTTTTPAWPGIAVVGCGQWGRNLVRNFANQGVLVAVVDSLPAQAEELASAHSVPSRDWHSILQDLNITAVVLATPAETHAAMAIEVLEAGKHVFVEKPLALAVEDGERVAAAAKKAEKIVMVGHIHQYHPAFLKLKAMVDDGELGRLQVEAHGSSYLHPDIADVTTTYLSFPSGINAHIFVSWLHPFKEQKLVVVGENAMAVFDDGQPWETKLCLFRNKVSWKNGRPEPSKGTPEPVVLERCEPLAEECHHFIECVRSGAKPRTHVDAGLSVLRILSAASESMRQGGGMLLKSIKSTQTCSSSAQVDDSAVIDEGCVIGSGTKIWHFSHLLKGTRIGKDCIIGQNVMIGPHVTVGDRCKIQNNVSLYDGVELEDGVFCGPSCVFTNVLTPRAEVERKSEFLPTKVRRGATIGANATIVCGNELGEHSMIGAGAVITKPVPPYALMVGNPARRVGWVSAAGERLGRDLVCPRTGERYKEAGPRSLLPVRDGCSGLLEKEKAEGQNEVGSLSTSLAIPFVGIQVQKARIRSRLDERISKVLDEGHFIMGPEVAEFEKQLSSYTGAAHVISCASGTDALTLALMALELHPGDAVLLPTFTFASTAETVALLGGIPVFIDIEPEAFIIDPTLISTGVEAARKAGHTPVGIIAVDLFGHPADYPALHAAASPHNLWILADAAQSIGASLHGQKVGTLARITTTSFFPAKPLGCYGDGGALLTDNAHLASIIRSLRIHGQGEHKYDTIRIGLNSRLDTIQAAVLLAKLDVFPDECAARQRAAARYETLLAGLEDEVLITPVLRDGVVSAWAQYTVRCKKRGAMMAHLRDKGVPTNVYYPCPLHLQPAYHEFPVANGACLVAERAAKEVFSLPMHPYLDSDSQERIATAIRLKSVNSD